MLRRTPIQRTAFKPKGRQSKYASGSWLKRTPLLRDSSQTEPGTPGKGIRRVGRLRARVGTMQRADLAFSKMIRERDGKCLNPHWLSVAGTATGLECSHFFGRAHYATRYDESNCVTFCRACHEHMEHQKHEGGDYWNFMLRRLGAEAFEALRVRSETRVKRTQAIEEFWGGMKEQAA